MHACFCNSSPKEAPRSLKSVLASQATPDMVVEAGIVMSSLVEPDNVATLAGDKDGEVVGL